MAQIVEAHSGGLRNLDKKYSYRAKSPSSFSILGGYRLFDQSKSYRIQLDFSALTDTPAALARYVP